MRNAIMLAAFALTIASIVWPNAHRRHRYPWLENNVGAGTTTWTYTTAKWERVEEYYVGDGVYAERRRNPMSGKLEFRVNGIDATPKEFNIATKRKPDTHWQ